MKIYTGVGDEGFTYFPDGRREPKSDPLVEAIGNIDEVNANLGLCLAAATRELSPLRDAVAPAQEELLTIGAMLAGAGSDQYQPRVGLSDQSITRLEGQIDTMWKAMPELKQLIIPGGAELSCRLHVARTVCRRAERRVVAAVTYGVTVPPVVLRYLNRLSDFLFAAARYANHLSGTPEQVWKHEAK